MASLVLQTLHQESIRQKRSAVALFSEGAVSVAVRGAGDASDSDSDSYRGDSNINDTKSSTSCAAAVLHEVHARIGEYLPIIDALVKCSGVEIMPHVREEYYLRKSGSLTLEEQKIFNAELQSKTKIVLDMLYHEKIVTTSEDDFIHHDGSSSPSSVHEEIYSAGGGEGGVEDASVENIPSILTAAEDLLEAIEDFGLAGSDAQPYLLNGAAIQDLLRNIPRGDAFGDVRHCCCHCIVILPHYLH